MASGGGTRGLWWSELFGTAVGSEKRGKFSNAFGRAVGGSAPRGAHSSAPLNKGAASTHCKTKQKLCKHITRNSTKGPARDHKKDCVVAYWAPGGRASRRLMLATVDVDALWELRARGTIVENWNTVCAGCLQQQHEPTGTRDHMEKHRLAHKAHGTPISRCPSWIRKVAEPR